MNPRPRWIVMSLILLTLAAFSEVTQCDFVLLDDGIFVYRNPEIRNGITWNAVQWAWSADLLYDSPNADYWQPVTLMARMIVVHFFGLNAALHHLVNLMLHLVNVLLLWHLLRKMTGSMLRSALVAALFAVHPLRVESVAWVTELKDLLSGLFFFLTLWAYLRYVAQSGRIRYLTVAGCFLLGLMSKPMLVTLPAVLLLLDFWPLRRITLENGRIPDWKPLVLEKIPLFAMSLGSFYLTWTAQSHVLVGNPGIPLPVQALAAFAFYLKQMLLPWPLAPHTPSLAPGAARHWAMVGALLLASLSFFCWRQRTRHPFLLMGWIWWILMLTPVLGLSDPFTANRFTYLPSIGLGILVIWGENARLTSLATRFSWNLRRIQGMALASALVILVLLAGLSRLQTRLWNNTVTLFTHSLRITGNDYFSHVLLGGAYMFQGRPEQALAHFHTATQMAPANPEARGLLATAHFELGNRLALDTNFPYAIAHYRETLRIEPGNPMAHYNLGICFLQSGRRDEAFVSLKKALDLKPNLALARDTLADLEKNAPKATPKKKSSPRSRAPVEIPANDS